VQTFPLFGAKATIRGMRDLIAEALKGHNADYIEAHFEESQATSITYRGERLEEISRARNCGGNIRALVQGSWGFVSFSRLDGLRDKVALAVEEAKLAGREPFNLFPTKPVVDTVVSQLKRDATTIPLATKKELLDNYNDIMLSSPKVQSSRINYRDGRRQRTFANSEGSYIEQAKTDLALRLTAIAREDSEVQQAGLSLGSNGEFSAVEGLHEQAREIARRAAALLSAPQVKGGEYTVILDPILAGTFAHEAFGHLSESDHVYQNEDLRRIMVLGKGFGGKHLNIVDNPTISNLRGSYKYDDEGTSAKKTYLIREGVLEPLDLSPLQFSSLRVSFTIQDNVLTFGENGLTGDISASARGTIRLVPANVMGSRLDLVLEVRPGLEKRKSLSSLFTLLGVRQGTDGRVNLRIRGTVGRPSITS